ncbi:hypothetical protein FHP25_34540 [Vineibacter terrae]|uniref:Uncharacterized protein n=1 Tax=Vineibacter terrae TaxID=2586908 RepID=A0A5C8P9T6_9HYPH|nr:hypothetical protein [Vineibacter terrae]TXL70445.1 hypothetical protein FHP25_34540 [Vineibacter terrae]
MIWKQNSEEHRTGNTGYYFDTFFNDLQGDVSIPENNRKYRKLVLKRWHGRMKRPPDATDQAWHAPTGAARLGRRIACSFCRPAGRDSCQANAQEMACAVEPPSGSSPLPIVVWEMFLYHDDE